LIAVDKHNKFSVKPVVGFDLAHYKNKIYIPESLTTQLVEWYHELLVHSGTSRLEATLRQHCWCLHLRKEVEAFAVSFVIPVKWPRNKERNIWKDAS